LLSVWKPFSKTKMLAVDVLYTAVATIGIMILLQVTVFFVMRLLTPPEAKIIYREVMVPTPVPQYQAPPQPQTEPPPAFTQPPPQEVKLPEYEPRKPTSDSLRVDPQLPPGLQETRPIGL
jgi:hypothetical protein